MTILDAILLGIVQGLTEFLPVSSSGHLILAREFFGVGLESGLAFDAILQFATACAVAVYFRTDLFALAGSLIAWMRRKEIDLAQKRLFVGLLIGTVPAILVGLLLESVMETIFRHGALVAEALLAGSLIMYAAERWGRADDTVGIAPPYGKSLLIGCFQALALVPGMSRSGMTIAGGMLLGLSREQSARFSFLLAIPILLGTGAKKMIDIGAAGVSQADSIVLIAGMTVSFLVGLAVIHYLLRFLRTHSMMVFVWYRIVLATVIIALTLL